MVEEEGKTLKILVVDDSEIALEATREILEEDGHQVLVRNEPMGTGAAILRERPNLVVLDVTMPLVDGEHITRLVKEDKSLWDVIVILYSDREEAELSTLAAACGADGYLRKTGDPALLRAAVRRWARGSAAFETVGKLEGPPPDGSLLILDTPTERPGYERAFGSRHTFVFATESDVALRKMAGSAPPAAAIVEMCLPGVNADAFLDRALRMHARWRGRILFVCAQPWRRSVRDFRATKRAPVLEKPVNWIELKEALELALVGDA